MNFRKILNIFKNENKVVKYDIQYTDVKKYLHNITCISINNKNDQFLYLILKKYPPIFDDKYIIKYFDLLDHYLHNFLIDILNKLIITYINENRDLIKESDNFNKKDIYYCTCCNILLNYYKKSFLKDYINNIGFKMFSYLFLRQSKDNVIVNYLKVFKLMNYDDIKLKYYILYAFYHLDDNKHNLLLLRRSLMDAFNHIMNDDLLKQINLIIYNKAIINFKQDDDDFIEVIKKN